MFDDKKNIRQRIIIFVGIEHAKTTMPYIYTVEGNYDSFECDHKEVILSCREIEKNYYGEKGSKVPIITHNALIDSQAACIYSPLNKGEGWFKKNFWYCADSTGRAGYTEINPGSPGYCVDGKSAICPPFLE